jgi:selenophosphate synthetase-related protein
MVDWLYFCSVNVNDISAMGGKALAMVNVMSSGDQSL